MMDGRAVLVMTPYLVSFTMAVGVGIYAWYRRNTRGAFPFALLALAEAVWVLRYLVVSIRQDLAIPVFWDNLQFIAVLIWPLVFIVFTLCYTARTIRRSKLLLTLPAIITLALLALTRFGLWPASIHTRIPDEFAATLVESMPLITQFLWFWTGCLFACGLVILFLKFITPRHLSRTRISIVFIGALFPAAGIMIPLIKVPLPLYQDHLTPLAFGISNLLMAWGIFASWKIPLVEMAHYNLLSRAEGIVIVGDTQNYIVHLNLAAEQFFASFSQDSSSPVVIGRPVADVLAQWPELAQHYQHIEDVRTELALELQDKEVRHFDLALSPLRSRRGRLLGRLMVLRDITSRKRTEETLHETEARLQTTEEALRETEANLQETRETLQRKESKLSHTEQTLQTTQTELRQTEQTLQTTQTKLHQAEHTLDTTESKLRQTEQTLQTTETKLRQTEQTLHATETELHQREQTLHTTESKLHQAEQTLQTTETKLRQTEQTLHATESQLHQNEEALQTSETTRQETEKALQVSESKLQETNDALRATEAKLQKTENALKKSESRRQQVEDAFKEGKNRLRQAQKALRASETKRQQAEDALKDNRNRLQQTQEAFQANEAKYQQAEEALKNTENRPQQREESPQATSAPDRQKLEMKKRRATKDKRLPTNKIPEHLAVLPDDILSLLEEAAAQLNPFKIARVLEHIWEHDASLAEVIEGLASHQNYKRLTEFVQQAKDQKEA